MTTSPGWHAPEPRVSLSRFVGRLVTVEATYTAEARRRHSDKAWIYLIKDVTVYPSAWEPHIWLELPQHVRRRLYAGSRFTFQAEVIQYERSASNTQDFGLAYVGWVKG